MKKVLKFIAGVLVSVVIVAVLMAVTPMLVLLFFLDAVRL